VYCCELLRTKIAEAGERGTAILVKPTAPGYGFVLQSRGVAARDGVTCEALAIVQSLGSFGVR
jgi:hypothetical protein